MAGATLGAVDLTSLHPSVLSTRTSCVLMMSPLVRSTAIPVPSSKVNTSPANFSPVGVTPDTSCPIPQSAAPIVRYGSEGRWGAHRAGEARQNVNVPAQPRPCQPADSFHHQSNNTLSAGNLSQFRVAPSAEFGIEWVRKRQSVARIKILSS